MLKKSPLILLIIVLVNVSVFAQKGSNRIEFDVKDDYENEQTYPMGSFGIIQEAIAEDANDGQVEIKSELYSTDLVLKKSFSILIKSRSKIEDHFEEDGVHYSLYRGPRDYIAIVTLDTKNLTCTKVEGEYKDSDPFENMKVANGKAVFKTNHSKISILVIVDLKTGATKGIPFRIEDYGRTDVTIEDYQVYDNEILTFVNAKKNSKNIDLFIWKLNYNGDQTEFYNVTSGIEEKLITVQATKIEEKYVLTGTFSRNKQATSQGIFIAEVANKKLNFMKFYNFLELKNFKDYLPQKQQDKIERQKERKEGYGKELLLDFNIATHPIISTKDGYEFLGEAYKPTYRTTSTGMGMNGMSNYTTVFDGYQYTHAVLAKFDKQGKLLWDNTFTMSASKKPMKVKKFIKFMQNDSNLNLVFSSYNSIISKSFNPISGSEIKSVSQEIIDTYNSNDKVKRSYSDIEYWYDDNFIAFGEQVIINKEAEKRKRTIIFLNKIAIEAKNKN